MNEVDLSQLNINNNANSRKEKEEKPEANTRNMMHIRRQGLLNLFDAKKTMQHKKVINF